MLEEGLRTALRDLARQLPDAGGSDLSACDAIGHDALDGPGSGAASAPRACRLRGRRSCAPSARRFTADDPGPRPDFRMLAEVTATGSVNVTMGHAAGLVTINLAGADAPERARRREILGKPYRTLMGHFRHEIAHVPCRKDQRRHSEWCFAFPLC